jgi:hypothetical protein
MVCNITILFDLDLPAPATETRDAVHPPGPLAHRADVPGRHAWLFEAAA